MRIYKDISLTGLCSFEFWGGAVEKAVLFTFEELKIIEQILTDEYPEGIEETALNDLFWFECETLCDWIGITEDELFERETA